MLAGLKGLLLFVCVALLLWSSLIIAARAYGAATGAALGYIHFCAVDLVDVGSLRVYRGLLRQRNCVWEATWSPDGTALAAVISTGRSVELVTVAAVDGIPYGEQRVLLTNRMTLAGMAWSPDATRLAFWANLGNNVWELRMINRDGSGQRVYGTYRLIWPRLTWSPDGARLAFAATPEAFLPPNEEIFSLDLHTGTTQRLTANDFRDTAPTWSPDGMLLFASAADNAGYDLYSIDAAGQQRQLTSGIKVYMPVWSPDGHTVAFMSNRDRANELYTLDAACFAASAVCIDPPRRLTFLDSFESLAPIWLP